jgi:hypothetical protein
LESYFEARRGEEEGRVKQREDEVVTMRKKRKKKRTNHRDIPTCLIEISWTSNDLRATCTPTDFVQEKRDGIKGSPWNAGRTRLCLRV